MNFSRPQIFAEDLLHNEFKFCPSSHDYQLYFYNSALDRELGLGSNPDDFTKSFFRYLEKNPLLAQNYVIENIYGRSVAGDGRSGLMAEVQGSSGSYELSLKG